MSDMTVADGTTQLTLQAADRIRDLIIRRVLLPGEKIRQVELANRVGVSRSPLREALRTLDPSAGDLARRVVETVYADVDPVLWGAAELSVRAQIEYLRGQR